MRHVLVLALVACSGEDKDESEPPPPVDGDADTDTDSDADTDTDTDSETGTDTESPALTGPITPGLYLVYPTFVYYVDGVPPPPESGDTGPVDISAAYMRLDAYFGYDGNGNVIETNINGTPVPSQVTVYYGTAAWALSNWSTEDTDQYCTVIVPLVGGLAPWVAPIQRLWWGTEYVGGPLGGTCGTALSPVDTSLIGDPIVDWQGVSEIGAGVGTMTPEVEDEISADLGPDMIYAFGGQLRLSPFYGPDTPNDDAYAFVYEIDLATGSLVIDAFNQLVLIEADDVHPYP